MTKPKVNPAAVGIFIAGATVILVASVVLFGSGRFFRKTKDMLLTFREPVTGLNVGAPVKLLGVTVGSVKAISLEAGATPTNTWMISVLIEIERGQSKLMFRDFRVDLDNRERFERIVRQNGLRGRLETLSLLSGQLYIALDMYPGQEGFQLNQEKDHGYWEIPTLPSTQRELMQSLVTSLQHLTELDFKGVSTELKALLADLRLQVDKLDFGAISTNVVGVLTGARNLLEQPALGMAVTNLNRALDQVNQLGESLNKNVNPLLAAADADLRKAGVALDQASEALGALKSQVQPGSPLTLELIGTLDRASEAMNALRQLAEQLQRNPNSILTGKKGPNP